MLAWVSVTKKLQDYNTSRSKFSLDGAAVPMTLGIVSVPQRVDAHELLRARLGGTAAMGADGYGWHSVLGVWAACLFMFECHIVVGHTTGHKQDGLMA